MVGTAGEPGVVPMAIRDVFALIQGSVGREFLLRVAYMELYNEDINDLLAPESGKLQVSVRLDWVGTIHLLKDGAAQASADA